MQFSRKPRRSPTLNIIPLIDVLVVLLIFYIATTVFKKPQPKINIVVPNSTTATVSTDTQPSILSISADSKMFIDSDPVDPDKLADALKAKLAANPSWKVAMKADKSAPFGAIMKVLDAAKIAGIGNIPTFGDTPKPGDAPSP